MKLAKKCSAKAPPNVHVVGGEAVLGATGDIFPQFPIQFPPYGKTAVYFSVPGATYEAFKNQLDSGGSIAVHHGEGTLLGEPTRFVRLLWLEHCVMVELPPNNRGVLEAAQAFEESGRVRFLLASQEVAMPLIMFECAWTSGESAFDPVKAGQVALAAAELTGKKDMYLTLCHAETPKQWRQRLAREARP